MITRITAVLVAVLWLSACSSPMTRPVTDYPVQPGEVGPIHPDNPKQQPFACTTSDAGLGDPLVDNQQGTGQPIEGRFLLIPYTKGYSANCGAGMQVTYYYRATDDKFYPLPAGPLPDNISYLQRDGEQVPFVVRFERGVINRFIYGITMLAEPGEQPAQPQSRLWNKRLLMMFHGGVGVGRHQAGGTSLAPLGKKAAERTQVNNLFNVRLLSQGYALTASSGTTTDTSFHLPLLAQTAGMIKQQFIARYGQPEMTLGFGGSGGSIQQFYNARTQPDLLDGMIVSHMFPDLLTQINGVGDCELLQYYFDRGHQQAGQLDPFWQRWSNRSLVEGFNAIDGYRSKLTVDGTGRPMLSTANPGSSVCVEGWHAMVQLVFNPKFFLPYIGNYDGFMATDPHALRSTHWTHWDDGVEVYGRDAEGYALRTYDNVGVQYGLDALRRGDLSSERFLHLNARVGGWLPSSKMQLEQAPYYPFGLLALEKAGFWTVASGNVALSDTGTFISGVRNAVTLMPDDKLSPLLRLVRDWLGKNDRQSIWSHHNTTASLPLEIAPRAEVDPAVIERARQAQLLFDGRMPVPTIGLMPYLEEKLDIHDSRQPFIIRAQMRQAGEDLNQFSIWGVKPGKDKDENEAQLDQIMVRAIGEMERWVAEGRKPTSAQDACWDEQYQMMAQGETVWAGSGAEQNGESAKGVCTQAFPIYRNPRVAAGEPFVSNLLKCELKPVSAALVDGTYGETKFSPQQISFLQQIFPQGVCDYDAPAGIASAVDN